MKTVQAKRKPAYTTVAKKLREVIESALCQEHQSPPSWSKSPCVFCDLVKEARDIADRALARPGRKQ